MNNELNFISLIEQALSSDAPEENLIKAFKEIESTSDVNQIGYVQFQMFMNNIRNKHDLYANRKTFDTHTIQELNEKLRSLDCHLISYTSIHHYNLFVKCNDQVIRSIPLSEIETPIVIETIEPGYYEFQLNSGQVIWSRELDQDDLIEEEISHDKFLRLAAHTNEPKYDIELLDGKLNLQIYSGNSYGLFKITVIRKDT